jgi:RND family efflux transporter MFP subunit
VQTAPAISTDLPIYTEAGGIVTASESATVASRIVAPVDAVLVRTGDRVRRGQTLLTLDARELTARADHATAALAAATEAARAAGSRSDAATAHATLAASTHARVKALHERRSATAQEMDQAEAALHAARAQADSARADFSAATRAREAATADVEAARVGRSYAVLTAPFDGVVAERLADPGSLAAPGVALLVVEATGPARLDVRVDESRAAGLKAGGTADVRLDTDSTSGWQSTTIVEIGRADPATHTVLVTLQLPASVSVRSGSFGRARFTRAIRRTMTLPSSSLIRRAGLTFVFAVQDAKEARLRPVSVGAIEGDVAEILAGLSEGDLVVVSPPAALTDGSAIRVAAAAADPAAGGAASHD